MHGVHVFIIPPRRFQNFARTKAVARYGGRRPAYMETLLDRSSHRSRLAFDWRSLFVSLPSCFLVVLRSSIAACPWFIAKFAAARKPRNKYGGSVRGLCLCAAAAKLFSHGSALPPSFPPSRSPPPPTSLRTSRGTHAQTLFKAALTRTQSHTPPTGSRAGCPSRSLSPLLYDLAAGWKEGIAFRSGIVGIVGFARRRRQQKLLPCRRYCSSPLARPCPVIAKRSCFHAIPVVVWSRTAAAGAAQIAQSAPRSVALFKRARSLKSSSPPPPPPSTSRDSDRD